MKAISGWRMNECFNYDIGPSRSSSANLKLIGLFYGFQQTKEQERLWIVQKELLKDRLSNFLINIAFFSNSLSLSLFLVSVLFPSCFWLHVLSNLLEETGTADIAPDTSLHSL